MAMTLRREVLGARDLWWFEPTLALELPDFRCAELVYEGTYTRIRRHPDRDSLVSKLFWVKAAPRDHLRKYWSCQASREIVANRTMQRLGLVTADLKGFGIPVVPWARVESILFMCELPAHDTLRVVLRNTTDTTRRAALLDHVAADVAAIYRNGYHHKDCHLENVLWLCPGADAVNAASCDGQFIWIDNDLRYCAQVRRARQRLRSALQQLWDTSSDFISTSEWRAFTCSLAHHLRRTDLGCELAATTGADFTAAFQS